MQYFYFKRAEHCLDGGKGSMAQSACLDGPEGSKAVELGTCLPGWPRRQHDIEHLPGQPRRQQSNRAEGWRCPVQAGQGLRHRRRARSESAGGHGSALFMLWMPCLLDRHQITARSSYAVEVVFA